MTEGLFVHVCVCVCVCMCVFVVCVCVSVYVCVCIGVCLLHVNSVTYFGVSLVSLVSLARGSVCSNLS